MRHLLVLLFASIFLTVSCIPVKPSSKRRVKNESSSSQDNAGAVEEPSFNSRENAFWFTGEKIIGTINLNQDISTVIYLRGSEVHQYLSDSSNMDKTHCLVAGFSSSGAKKQLRIRAVPISFFNFESREQEKLFRIDIPETALNQSSCDGLASLIDSNGNQGANTSDTAFSLDTLCPTCTGNILSSSIALFSSSNGLISSSTFISYGLVNLKGVAINISIKSNFTGDNNSCSNTNCKAKGFDCCIEGQCAIDGQLKPSASSQEEYLQAIADVANNSESFVNYPNIYFVCSNPPPKEEDPLVITNPEEEAQKRFEQKLKDYRCLEEGKKDTPNYATGTCTIAGQISDTLCLLNGGTWDYDCAVGNCSDSQYNNKTSCEAFSKVWTTIYNNGEQKNGTVTAYETIRADVWDRCGCEAEPFPTDPANPQCPDFGLKPVLNTNNNIVDIICDVPPPPSDPTPIQNISFNLDNRSSPHRFFRSDNGGPIDDLSDINKLKINPEGLEFSYLDEVGKTAPQNSEFNMNAILGQFNVELTQALPAASFPVEFDQTYIISAISGFYTPCPTCQADSWFPSFSAYPATSDGMGLQARGFISNRSEYQGNSTNGNYEDTIFGRACWLPPTMLPFSHKSDADVQTQRLNRLATQAAMYVNGYQRDWFGFNKGALIGSFDGVKWFAIGNGRKVTATSTKLFLAINAPYADLASASSTMVSIATDLGGNTVADYDYNPDISLDDPRQNQGATCQVYHQCQTDSDCVTKLGWEYMCIDTSDFRSRWPVFDIFANEKANSEISESTVKKIIQGIPPSGSNLRCVYRGAGAPCKGDLTTLASGKQKMFTCAPNFYCSDVGQSDFNNQTARTLSALDAILYSQETDVLGRPLFYIGSGVQLPDNVKTNLKYNAQIFSPSIADQGDYGLCRPGKRLGSRNYFEAHQDKDSQRRTDYISQVSSCDSSNTTLSRIQTCPLIETRDNQTIEKGNYIFTTTSTVFDAINNIEDKFLSEQNTCGSHSRYNTGSEILDTFKQIELEPLRSLSSITGPSLSKDACFRRAGSVCHTDLDCSPNRLHAEQSSFFDNSTFGGTIAEKKYWQEHLICGQAAEKPSTTLIEDYNLYDLTKNRCCREVGQEITMYTQVRAGFPANSLYSTMETDNTPLLINFNIHTSSDITSENGRYSRYQVASPVEFPTPNFSTPKAVMPIVDFAGGSFTSSAYQWKAMNDTAKLTCCGGGWVRKFADGSHDWSNRDRLNINPDNFKCLNYENDLTLKVPTNEVNPNNYSKDYGNYCLSPAEKGCAQVAFPDPSTGIEITPPSHNTALDSPVTISTTPTEAPGGSVLKQVKSSNAPFMPIPYLNKVPLHHPSSPDCNTPGAPFNYMIGASPCNSLSFYLPSYIGGVENIESISVEFYDNNGVLVFENDIWSNPIHGGAGDLNGYRYLTGAENTSGCTLINGSGPYNLSLTPDFGFPASPQEDAMWTLCKGNPLSGEFDIFHLKAKCDSDGGGVDGSGDGDFCNDDSTGWSYGGVTINYYARNSTNYLYGPATATNTAVRSLKSGNDLYYLTKLGRLELLGVPQISYEPIACNSDRSQHVPNIYKNINTMADFFASSLVYNEAINNSRELVDLYSDDESLVSKTQDISIDYNGDATVTISEQKVILADDVSNNIIFDSHQFLCCAQLGQKVSSADRCCTNFAVDGDGGTKICRLPSGANLSLYFNRFISGDGTGEDSPGGGLEDSDFVPETGEPKLSDNVIAKLKALGEAYCENNKTRRGGAFGDFLGEPNNDFYVQEGSLEDSTIYSIIDSIFDGDSTNASGYKDFQNGFRWDHHIYCE